MNLLNSTSTVHKKIRAPIKINENIEPGFNCIFSPEKHVQLTRVVCRYCMNDEASVHYAATIDQMSEGLMWLQREVGGPDYDVTPTIAWQVGYHVT